MHRSRLGAIVIDCRTEDLETDDVEAEVARVEALGAKRVEQIRTWWVMGAPTGQRFCVIKP